MPAVDAIVIAGGIPKPDEPLYPLTQGKSKALLDIAGQPMIQWVLDALSEAQTIRRVVVIGLEDDQFPPQPGRHAPERHLRRAVGGGSGCVRAIRADRQLGRARDHRGGRGLDCRELVADRSRGALLAHPASRDGAALPRLPPPLLFF